jgi:hypothetical protein
VTAGFTALVLVVLMVAPGGLAVSRMGFKLDCKAASEKGGKSTSELPAARQQPAWLLQLYCS